MNILDELNRLPFPKCAHCDTRAHGIFTRRMTVRELEPGDNLIDERTVYASWRDKTTGKHKRAKINVLEVERFMLLCAGHGFSLSGTTLIRSLNTSAARPETSPVEHEQAALLDKFTTLRRATLPSVVPQSILEQYRRP